MRVAFDSRPGASAFARGAGHDARRLLQALRDTAGDRDEILETHRPRSVEVFHAPWIEGAMLHSPCPMVVTVHDVAALTRRSERLRCGGVHLRMRHLALQRATHVIVPTAAVAGEAVDALGLDGERVVVIPAAPDPTSQAPGRAPCTPPVWTWEDVGRETWRVYEEAVAQPERPCVASFSRRLAARAPRGPSSAGS